LFENTVGWGLSDLTGGRGGEAWRAVVVIDRSDNGWVCVILVIDDLIVIDRRRSY
jgi:hypothetical protein